jgi:hypothetical protein
MRQALREKDKRIKELEQSSAPKPIEVGEKPTLAGCDYDEDKFAEELEAFKDREAAAKRQSATQAEQSRKANEEWQADLGAFEQEKAGLDFPDRDEAIETATSSLDMVQQAVIVKAAAKPALFMVRAGQKRSQALRTRQDPRPNQAGGCCRPHGRSRESDHPQSTDPRQAVIRNRENAWQRRQGNRAP